MRRLPSLSLFAGWLVFASLGASQASAQTLDEEYQTEEERKHEFVQTRTCDPNGEIQSACDPGQQPLPVQWNSNSVDYLINDRGSQDIHPDQSELTDELKHATIDTFEVWNEQECSDFEMNYAGKTLRDWAGFNEDVPVDENANIVVWQDAEWPNPQYQAVALTTVTFRPSNGEILSADIELNTDDYNFSTSPDHTEVDLQNTLTHEVGHFLGLDHSPNPSSTMYYTAEMGETSKRQLHDSDIAGLCHIYPEGQQPDLSDPTNGAGTNGGQGSEHDQSRCATTASAPDPVLALLALLVVGTALIRRRENRSP